MGRRYLPDGVRFRRRGGLGDDCRSCARGCCTSTSTSSSPPSRCCAGPSWPGGRWSSAGAATRRERGVVATASYEARAFGVGSGTPLRVAARRLPGRGVPPGRQAGLRRRERRGDGGAPLLPGRRRGAGVGRGVPRGGDRRSRRRWRGRSRRRCATRPRLECSVGIGDNKLQAKIATSFGKPQGDRAADQRRLGRGHGGPADHRAVGDRCEDRAAPRRAWASGPSPELAAADARRARRRDRPDDRARGSAAWAAASTPRRSTPTPWVPRAHGRETTFQVDLTDWAEVAREARRLAAHGGRGPASRGPAGRPGRGEGALRALRDAPAQPHAAGADLRGRRHRGGGRGRLLGRLRPRPRRPAARRPGRDDAGRRDGRALSPSSGAARCAWPA